MTLSITTPERIGLIAGEGQLPLHVAQAAMAQGTAVVAFTLSVGNRAALSKHCASHYAISPGLLEKTLGLIRQEGLDTLVFAGKVNKWTLLKNPQMDGRAIALLKAMQRLNDDAMMLALIEALEAEGIRVLEQTRYMQDLFLSAGVFTEQTPTDEDWQDIAYGFEVAKEMGRLDIGQTIVARNRMILAVEAIEGTDACIRRSQSFLMQSFGGMFWPSKPPKAAGGVVQAGGCVVKVAKPAQDLRFDVPTVGLRTLEAMRKAGLRILATESHQTLLLDREAMQTYANRHGLCIVSVDPAQLNTHEQL